ncbi:SAM-dependent methyltransferase [Paenibacillus swuensis]|uniref:SAM-dependent methyltransferase n=1 Tax=Paenibacillus swuensis TaxID=1178515 RepID=A0A172TLR8_9BACL|nr:SAM-dependent methyltransferase [Paenibacillus swuensis]ANE47854.1 SAM-dependent methyltransferase [Paenibacillus swuensis]
MTEQHREGSSSRFIGTSNIGYAQQAQEEIRRLFGSARFSYIVPSEVFIMELNVREKQAVQTLTEQEPMFLRHFHPIQAEYIQLEGDEINAELLKEQLSSLCIAVSGKNIAVQIRRLPQSPLGKEAMKEAVEAVFRDCRDVQMVLRDADLIVSVYATMDRIYMGISKPLDNLSDWSGGSIRFRKEEGQISRAKFKLLEAEQKFGFSLDQFHKALDIGAAPGGWTSLLLERGLTVTAVDPAFMAPELLKNPNLKHLKKNAGEVQFKPGEFDLLVCDMSWSPKMMSKLISELLYAVRPGGNLVITVKLMHKKAFQTVREVLSSWEDSVQLLQAKQLFHNRDELTLYLMKN